MNPEDDPWRRFIDALPDWARNRLRPETDPRAVADVHTLISEGWEPHVLADYATQGTRRLYNAAQVMRHRLHRAAQPDDPHTQL